MQRPAENSSESLILNPSKPTGTAQTPTQYDIPVRLTIPKIKVSAKIDQMGLTAEGDMQSPSKPADVGWYKLGARPGNEGSAVVAGHYSWSNQAPAAFSKLQTLQKGDLIHVEDKKKATATFVVRELRTYGQDDTAPEVFSSRDKKAHLNLITCQGEWDVVKQTYADRLVVFAEKT